MNTITIIWTFNMIMWIFNALISINNNSIKSLRFNSISASLVCAFSSLIIIIDNIN